MVICRTPFRISFFGGGTDYPAWYLEHGGQVLAATIDKYCYLTCRHLPPFFEHRIRVVYSIIENRWRYEEIQHPAVRETMRFLAYSRGIEIHHDGDLPARSGMGSSSSFTVGLLHALYALMGTMPGKNRLATESIHIEQDMIQETVGSQDQISAAYGGLNHILFKRDGTFDVRPVTVPHERLAELNDHLMLFYTGIKRTASDIAKTYTPNLEAKSALLNRMSAMVDEAITRLSGKACIHGFGELLHESWMLKRSLGDMVSNAVLDDLYQTALDNGALGGKLLGAGGGGFLLLFVPTAARQRVREALKDLILVPFSFEHAGSQVIFYEPERDNPSLLAMDNARLTAPRFRELDDLPDDSSGACE